MSIEVSTLTARRFKEMYVELKAGRADIATCIECYRGARLIATVQTGFVQDRDLAPFIAVAITGWEPSEVVVVREMVSRLAPADETVRAGQLSHELATDPATDTREALFLVAVPRDDLAHTRVLRYEYADTTGGPPVVSWLDTLDFTDAEEDVARLVDIVRQAYAAPTVHARLTAMDLDDPPDARAKIDHATARALKERGCQVLLVP